MNDVQGATQILILISDTNHFQDATIKLWDFETGDYERTMKGHTDSVQVKQCSVQNRVLEAHISDVSSDSELLIGVQSAFLCWTNQSGDQSGQSIDSVGGSACQLWKVAGDRD